MTSIIRVLSIEDSRVHSAFLARCFKAFKDFQLENVETLAEGIKRVAQGGVDIVLLDLSLPDSNGLGLETLKQFQKQAPDIPVVVMTSLDNKEVALEAVRIGAQDYLVKDQADKRVIEKALRYSMERQQMSAKLNRSSHLAAIGELAAGVAHEINNPVTFTQMNLTLLQDHLKKHANELKDFWQQSLKQLDSKSQKVISNLVDDPAMFARLEEMQEMIEDNLSGVERICNIVKDLRTFSRIEKENVELVKINEVVDVACNFAYNSIRHRARLVKDLGRVPLIQADRSRLTQVIVNLLLNAAHAVSEGAPDDNQIKVSTRKLNGHLIVSVEDTGCGIAPDVKERIFETFFTTKTRGHGTGLGLSISSEHVRKHGGEIQVESKLGEGSQFKVQLPLDTGLELSERPVEVSEQDVGGQGARVLVIDDELPLQRIFRRLLGSVHEVVCASNGREGIKILDQDSNFDVIICDLMMPELDGVAVYNAVKKAYGELADRIVFLSGGAVTPRTKEFVGSVDNMFLEKPVSGPMLKGIISRLVRTDTKS